MMRFISKIAGKPADHHLAAKLLLFFIFSVGIAMLSTGLVRTLNSTYVVGMLITVCSVSVVSLAYLSYLLVRPIQKIIKTTDAIGAGDFKRRVSITKPHLLGRLAVSINDMTEILENRLKEASLLQQISEESTLSRNLNKVLSLILEKAVNFKKASAGSIMLVDNQTGDLIVRASANLGPGAPQDGRVSPGEGIAGWVARKGKPIMLNDRIRAPEHLACSTKVKNAVSLPILLDEKVVGVLNLSCKDTQNNRFEARDMDFLMTLCNHAAAAINNAQLFEELRSNYFSTIQSLAAAIDAKDPYIHGHSARVAEYAVVAAKELQMSFDQMETIQAAAYLHDIGKIGIPGPILTKPGALTSEEFDVIKTHPEISARIISPVNFSGEVVAIVKHHHERFDGRGYPDKIKGIHIPLEARILAVADAFDAMTSVRPYRPPRDMNSALDELRHCSGTQFDSTVVDAFVKAVGKTKMDKNPQKVS